jgi:copper chaperone CopZ
MSSINIPPRGILSTEEPNMDKFKIIGMSCNSCVQKITEVFNHQGYPDAKVTLHPPIISFSSSAISKAEIERIISTAGNYKIASDDVISSTAHHLHSEPNDERLTPLFVILTYIVGGVLLRAWIGENYSFATIMNNFMGSFFTIFSLFKLLNPSGFADAYATYDIIASRSRVYGFLYPYIELLLGLLYFVGFAPFATNMITLILMLVSSMGVFQALRMKRKLQCACLGTALKLPMTKVTLIEDISMGAMALIMIVYMS